MGVYYYDVEDGEVLLTLSLGNNFTIAGPGMNKTGTYTIDGTNLSLDFFKDEDGTTTATLEGDSLALIYGEAKMNFLKKISYTVSFNVDGGSAVAPVKVTNGKVVAEPAVPTKENNVFLGWYADAKLTTPFAFDTTVIKADTTIYAKWAEKTIGVAEYTVDFDLGYEAEAPKALTTISGKAYGVTAPERQGYTFGGWWISMTDDATKLSYAYTDNTVFTADTTLYAVWYEDGATKLNTPAVSVSDKLISWGQVSGANSYVLTVTAPDGTVLIDNEKIAATVKTYDFSILAAGEYTVSVVAVSNDETKTSDAAVRYYTNKALDKVGGFQVVNGILVFNAVKNAEKYIITVDCGDDNHKHTAFDNGNRTTFYLANCPMQAGGIKVTVTAVANGYASSTSKTFAYDLTLDKIANVVYDASKDAFVWDAVAGAAEYIVTVKMGENTYVVNNGSFTTFSAAPYTGNITVSVVPATQGYNSPEGAEATCAKTIPAQPAGLTVNNMTITWAEAAGAVKYEVKIGDQNVTVETNSIDLIAAGLVLTQGETYDVQVKAVSAANEASVYSEALKVGYVAMINSLSYSKNTVSWAPVLGVNTFKVRVNGGSEKTVIDATSARVALTKEGENVIEVKFVAGETESEWVAITVNAIAVEYDTRSTFGSFYTEYLAIGDEFILPDATFNGGFAKTGYTFAAWATSPLGSESNGTILEAGDIFTGNTYTILYATWTPNEYKVTLNTTGYEGLENGVEVTVTYTKNFTLPVPTHSNAAFKFAGWYTQPYGEGRQITDGTGASVVPYDYARDIELYPYFTSNALTFILRSDGNSYQVKAGPGISEITDVVIPVTYNGKPVTHMEDSSFNSQSNILTMSIPDTIQYIGTKAFRSALNLQKVEVYKAYPDETYEVFYASANGALLHKDMGIWYLECVPKGVAKLTDTNTFIIPREIPALEGEKVTAIKVEAFRYTVNLEHVVIHNDITDIPPYAFNSISALKSVTIEEGTNPIVFEKDSQGRYPFVSCNSIETFNLPANFEMPVDEFKSFLSNYTKLQAVHISETNKNYRSLGGMLTNVDGDTIIYCPKGFYGVVSIPREISKIDDNAFAGNNAITDVTIPIWVTNVGKQAFSNASALKTVTIAGGRDTDLVLGTNVFASCRSLETVTFTGNELGTRDTGKIAIPASAFYGSTAYVLHTVTIKAGANITSIGANAFYNQPSLKNFVVEAGAYVGTIGDSAFYNCTAFESFKVPATVKSIAQNAFANCTSLSDLTFEAATAEDAEIAISTFAFTNCTKLRAVVLPDHLSSFNSAAFEGCTALKSITVNTTNPNYKSENGILYKKSSSTSDDFAELLFYPTALIVENGGIIENLPATLVKIGGSAFSNNAGLVKITLPASITTIDTAAFKNCENLTEVVFTSGAAEDATLKINESAFENCTSLSTFVIPDYTTAIAKYAFRKSGLVNLVIPTKLTSLGANAFENCTALQTIEFKNTASVSIPNGGAFKGCTALTSVNLGANVSTVGTNAFQNCTALQTVTITNENSKLTKIDSNAFQNCPELTSINIPKTVTTIGTSAFAATADAPGKLTNITFELGGEKVLTINTKAFQYQSQLTRLDLPAGVKLTTTNFTATYTTAGNNVADLFLGCNALEAINIENKEGVTNTYSAIDGVLYTASNAVVVYCPPANAGHYEGDTPTYTITIPNTVELVLSKAFLNCSKITKIEFEEFASDDANYGTQLLTIAQNSFYAANAAFGGEFTSIKEIKLPSHLKQIGGYAFAVTGETETPMAIKFNQDAKNVLLNDYAFANCIAKELALPAVVQTAGKTSVGQYAFSETKLLERVSFKSFSNKIGTSSSNRVETIPDYFFYNASALKEFTIPSTIKTINTSAFSGCKSLETITIPSSVTKINGSAFSNSGLTSITLPSSITSSTGLASTNNTNSTFKDCTSLVSVTFEGKVSTLPSQCFYGCTSLTTVTFNYPTSLTTIRSMAFLGCSSLTSFDFNQYTGLTTVGDNAFSHTALTSIDLSKTTISTLNAAFNNIATLKSITLAPNMKALPSASTIKPVGDFNGYLVYGLPFDNIPAIETITLNSNFKPDKMLGVKIGIEYVSIFDYVMNNCPNAKIQISGDSLTGYTKDDFGVYYTSGGDVAWAPPSVNLESYTIDENAFAIGSFAFAYSNIKSIIIPSTLFEIQAAAFYHSNTTSVEVVDTIESPSELDYIADYGFAYSPIESFVIPDSVTEVGIYAFAYCTKLKSLTTGAKMSVINDGLIRGATALEELILQEGLEEIDGLTNSGGYDEKTSGYSLKKVVIPASVKTMFATFFDLDSLETVEFKTNSQLTELWSYVFYNCSSLKSVTLPGGVNYIEEGIFYGCTSLESVDLSATTIDTIWEYTFAYTESLVSVKFPATLTTIGDRAFYGTGLVNLEIPASITAFGLGVFENAAKLETVTFAADSPITSLDGENIEIGYYFFPTVETDAQLFKGTTSLKTVTIPNTMTEIGVSTFENSGIEKLMMTDPTAESSLNYIGDKAFAGCARLTDLVYVENPDSPEDMIVHNYLYLVTEIGEEAFSGCSALTSVTFGDDIEYIGDKAFANCHGLEVAYIPAQLTDIGGNIYEGIDKDKIEIDPAHTAFVLVTDADGTVYLKYVDSGEIIGSWTDYVEPTPEEPTPEEPSPEVTE